MTARERRSMHSPRMRTMRDSPPIDRVGPRADLLARVGAKAEALEAYELAIGLERDPAVRRFLQNRRIELQSSLCQAGFA